MSSKHTIRYTIYFTFLYVLAFSINSIANGNFEFIYYTGLMLLAGGVLLMIHKQFKFYPVVLLSISLVGLLHLLGGNLYMGDTRLYDFFFIQDILRYDNIVHMLGSAVMVMLAYAMLQPVVSDDFEGKDYHFIILLVLIGMGIGTINEMLEFLAVLVFDAAQQVGGYTNPLLDLVFNTIGSIITASILVKSKKRLASWIPDHLG